MGAAATKLQPSPVNVRVKISALWASMLFVFAYVDLFSLYRPDFRADIEAGEVAGFAVNQTFLLGTTALCRDPQPDGLLRSCHAAAAEPDRQHRPGRPLYGQYRRRNHR
jgi:hypothetical protein